MELDSKMEELKKSHRSSMMEMKDLLSRQKTLGDRCKSEMETLTKTFEEKSRKLKGKTEDLKDENQDLRWGVDDWGKHNKEHSNKEHIF